MKARDRRNFLKAAAAGLSLPWLAAACGGAGNAPANIGAGPALPAAGKAGTLLGFGAGNDGSFFIGTTDLDGVGRPSRQQQDISFLGHGFAPNPARPHLAVISQKHGKGCVEWDMRARKVTRRLSIPEAREFYGHGAFTPDGKTLYLVESIVDDGSKDGLITIRDGNSYEIRGEFPSGGVAPHDLLLIDQGRTLVITNGGGLVGDDSPEARPCVTYMDIATRKLKTRLTFATPRINAGHIAMTGKGELVVVSAPREGMDQKAADFVGGISFYTPGGEVRTAEDPIVARMKAETLSVAIHEPSMVVGATNPAGDIVTFWDFKTGKLLKAMTEFSWPRGISLTMDQRHFVLTYAHETHAALIDAVTLEAVAGAKIDRTYISGSHNYIYDAGGLGG